MSPQFHLYDVIILYKSCGPGCSVSLVRSAAEERSKRKRQENGLPNSLDCFTCIFLAIDKVHVLHVLFLLAPVQKKLISHPQAYAISAIAQWDWPEAWPQLFPQMMVSLSSGEPEQVHGAMRVLSGLTLHTLTLTSYCSLHKYY